MDQLSWPSVNHVNDDAIDDETARGSGAAWAAFVVAWAVVATVTPVADQTVCNDWFVIVIIATAMIVIMALIGT